LVEGIGSAFEEHGIPKLYSSTPDLDQATPGVIKALHSSFREKRCKEIRKWLKQNPKITHFCAIDDVDLSMPDKAALKSGLRDTDIFLDPDKEFVKTSPTTKWFVICCHIFDFFQAFFKFLFVILSGLKSCRSTIYQSFSTWESNNLCFNSSFLMR